MKLRSTGLLFAAAVLFPAAAGAGWRAIGPYGGGAEFVRASAAEPGLVLAGTRSGLLFRLDQGSGEWRQVSSPVRPGCVLRALEISPAAARFWIAGWDCEGRGGIALTQDGGASWAEAEGMENHAIWALAFAPGGERVLAGSSRGVFLSGDAGRHWRRASPAGNEELRPVVSVSFDRTETGVLYAGTTHLPWRSHDGGKTWSPIHAGMLDDSDVFSIRPDPHQPGRMFASACSGVYRSPDRGLTWRRLPTPAGAFRAYVVDADPRRADLVYAGTSAGLLRSADGGSSWRIVSRHPVKSLAFDLSSPSRVYAASPQAGVLVAQDGASFKGVQRGFSNGSFTRVTGQGGALYSIESGALYEYRNGNWRQIPNPLGHVDAISVSESLIAAASGARLAELRRGARSWTVSPAPASARIAGLALLDETLFVATPASLYRKGRTGDWRRVPLPTGFTGSLRRLESSAGTLAVLSENDAALSADAGRTWNRCGRPPGGPMHSLAGNRQYVLAATAAGLYRSSDSCITWTAVDGGLTRDTITVVTLHPADPAIAFAVQNGVVWRSADAGATWSPLADEGRFGNYPLALFVDASTPSLLYALLPGRGVLLQDLAPRLSTSSHQKEFHP